MSSDAGRRAVESASRATAQATYITNELHRMHQDSLRGPGPSGPSGEPGPLAKGVAVVICLIVGMFVLDLFVGSGIVRLTHTTYSLVITSGKGGSVNFSPSKLGTRSGDTLVIINRSKAPCRVSGLPGAVTIAGGKEHSTRVWETGKLQIGCAKKAGSASVSVWRALTLSGE